MSISYTCTVTGDSNTWKTASDTLAKISITNTSTSSETIYLDSIAIAGVGVINGKIKNSKGTVYSSNGVGYVRLLNEAGTSVLGSAKVANVVASTSSSTYVNPGTSNPTTIRLSNSIALGANQSVTFLFQPSLNGGGYTAGSVSGPVIITNQNMTASVILQKTVCIAYHPNGGTAQGEELNTYGWIKRNNTPYFDIKTSRSVTDLYNASTFNLTRTGYRFKGWGRVDDSSGKPIIVGDPLNETTAYPLTTYFSHANQSVTVNNQATIYCYLYAVWEKITYTNTIAHWKYVGTGGDSSDGSYKKMDTTTFTGKYGESVTIPTSHVKAYEGYFNTGVAGSSNAWTSDGTWLNKNIGSTFTQPAKNTWIDYTYHYNTLYLLYNTNNGEINSSIYGKDPTYQFVTRDSKKDFESRTIKSIKMDPYDASTFGLSRRGYIFNGWKIIKPSEDGAILTESTYPTYGLKSYTQWTDATKNVYTPNNATTHCYLYAQWLKLNTPSVTIHNARNYTIEFISPGINSIVSNGKLSNSNQFSCIFNIYDTNNTLVKSVTPIKSNETSTAITWRADISDTTFNINTTYYVEANFSYSFNENSYSTSNTGKSPRSSFRAIITEPSIEISAESSNDTPTTLTATLSLIDDGGESTAFSIKLKGTNQEVTGFLDNSNNQYVATFNNLEPNTMYIIEASATNSAGTVIDELTTSTAAGRPLINITNISPAVFSIDASFEIVSNQGSNILEEEGYGIKLLQYNEELEDWEDVGSYQSIYDITFTDLKSNTRYKVKCFATNSIGTTYLEEEVRTIEILPPSICPNISIASIIDDVPDTDFKPGEDLIININSPETWGNTDISEVPRYYRINFYVNNKFIHTLDAQVPDDIEEDQPLMVIVKTQDLTAIQPRNEWVLPLNYMDDIQVQVIPFLDTPDSSNYLYANYGVFSNTFHVHDSEIVLFLKPSGYKLSDTSEILAYKYNIENPEEYEYILTAKENLGSYIDADTNITFEIIPVIDNGVIEDLVKCKIKKLNSNIDIQIENLFTKDIINTDIDIMQED